MSFATLAGMASRRHILLLAVPLSAIIHVLLLASPNFLHWPPIPSRQEDAGISIDLETLAPALPASSREAPGGTAGPEKLPVEPERPALSPEPKKIRQPATRPAREARKKTSRTAKPQSPKTVAGSEKNVKSALQGAPTGGETRQPSPAGGAFSPQPAYPELARRRGQEGVVSIRCQIDPAGRVINAAIAQSSGFRLLDEAALKSLRQWKFSPALKDGAPIAGSVVVPVRFQLR